MKKPSDPKNELAVARQGTRLSVLHRVTGLVARLPAAMQPLPLKPPQTCADSTTLSAIERSAEVLRYSACRLEYWLSPGGRLRAWLRLNLLLAELLAIPSIILAPVITLFLATLASWTEYALIAAVNTLLTLVTGVGIVAVGTAAWFLLRSILRR